MALIAFLIFALFTLGASASSPSASEAGASSPSKSAEGDIICHTDNPAECYPKIFQATDEFQTVHDDQDLPSGLHVKMNIWSGLKEAKINVPDEQLDPSLEGLPVDTAMVIVDPESEPVDSDLPQIRKGAPEYEAVGKIKTPTDESRSFKDSLTVLKTLALDDRPTDAALDILKEISHDIYYGLKIAEDTNAVKSLLCMMSSQDVFAKEGGDAAHVTKASQAASIIGAALQNNQKALDEVEKAWGDIRKTTCEGTNLAKSVFSMLMPEGAADENAANGASLDRLTKAKAGALRGLIKSPIIRDDFLANGGMAQVLQVLLIDDPKMAPAQRKLANFVLDSFLDESMGAILGVWPRDDEVDHDWDHQMKTLAKQHKWEKDHWSVELWKKLQEQRQVKRASGSKDRMPPRVEL